MASGFADDIIGLKASVDELHLGFMGSSRNVEAAMSSNQNSSHDPAFVWLFCPTSLASNTVHMVVADHLMIAIGTMRTQPTSQALTLFDFFKEVAPFEEDRNCPSASSQFCCKDPASTAYGALGWMPGAACRNPLIRVIDNCPLCSSSGYRATSLQALTLPCTVPPPLTLSSSSCRR